MAESDIVYTGTDFHDKFDSTTYLDMYSQGFSLYRAGLPKHFLRHYHEIFKSLPGENLSILDYGSGPSILSCISAAPKASEIILSDYTEDNRQAVQKWLDRDPSAYDWTSYFHYVIRELEGKGDKEIKEREEQIRKLVKAVVPCDIGQDPPIAEEYNQQYDVVFCSLVLECALQTRDDYKAGMIRLGKLIKPGGMLLFFGVERSGEAGFYLVGDRKFRSLGVSSEFAVKAMEDAGLTDVYLDKIPAKNKDETVVGYIFMKGTKQ